MGADRVFAAVLGGGPAGATAARLLAAWGHDVILLTRPSVRPALAESLPPSALHALDRVGVGRLVVDAGFVRSTGNTVWWGGDAPRVEMFPEGTFGLQVERRRFDEILLDAVAGARVWRDASVRDVASAGPDTAQRIIRFEREGTVHEVRADWVLDCSGRAGVVARHGMRVSEQSPRTTALAVAWETESWELPDWTHTTVESAASGWAWSIPVSPSRRYVAVMLDPRQSPIPGAANVPDRYARALQQFPRHGALTGTAGTHQTGDVVAVDATSYHSASPAMPGVILAGDAASFVDPLASFGIKKAVSAAWLASVVVHTAVKTPGLTQAALDLYTEWERSTTAMLRQGALAFAVAAHLDDRRRVDEDYWGARAAADPIEDSGLDVRQLRDDVDVKSALEFLREASGHLALRWAPGCERVQRPLVRDNLVVMEAHLTTPRLSTPVRFLRNVDLIALADTAIQHADVPDILDAYNRRHPAVPLADLLGALAVLCGKRVLEHA
ncbi:MAG: tryptophan 7-halogenase [Gemmatimonadaceae bacterium]